MKNIYLLISVFIIYNQVKVYLYTLLNLQMFYLYTNCVIFFKFHIYRRFKKRTEMKFSENKISWNKGSK